MIKAGFIVGGASTGLSFIDEVYAEMGFYDNIYASTIDELFAEVAVYPDGVLPDYYGSRFDELYAEVCMLAPEWGSTVDELYVELSFASSL